MTSKSAVAEQKSVIPCRTSSIEKQTQDFADLHWISRISWNTWIFCGYPGYPGFTVFLISLN
jgi:hypothetical protein